LLAIDRSQGSASLLASASEKPEFRVRQIGVF
jgi:hypothetical protein